MVLWINSIDKIHKQIVELLLSHIIIFHLCTFCLHSLLGIYSVSYLSSDQMWQHGCTQDIPVPHPFWISMVRLSYLNVHRPILPSLLGATHLSILRTLRPRTPGLSGRTPCMFPAIQELRGHKQRLRPPDTGSCRLVGLSNLCNYVYYWTISIQPIIGHPSWLGGSMGNVW